MRGKGINEKHLIVKVIVLECNKNYFRPSEVDTLKGDCSKARRLLKWHPKHDIKSLIKDMISYELKHIDD